jgi:hypothetical protein
MFGRFQAQSSKSHKGVKHNFFAFDFKSWRLNTNFFVFSMFWSFQAWSLVNPITFKFGVQKFQQVPSKVGGQTQENMRLA